LTGLDSLLRMLKTCNKLL